MKKLMSALLMIAMLLSMLGVNVDSYASSGGNAVVADFEYCTLDHPYVRAKVVFEKLESNGTVYAGLYTSTGLLRQIKEIKLLKGSADMIISFYDESIASNDSIRVFFLDSLNTMKPLGKSIRQDFSTARLSGAVVGTVMYGGHVDNGQVEFSFYDAHNDPAWTEYLEKNAGKNGFADYTFNVPEDIDVDAFFGVAASAYVREISKNKYEIVDIVPEDDSKSIVISKKDIDFDETDSDAIYYYPANDSKKTDKIVLADSVKIYINYASETRDDFVTAVNKLVGDVEITIIENTGDSKFDMIIIKNYNYAIVEEVEANRSRFSTAGADGKTYTFDLEDEEISNKILNGNGEAISLSDFNENDVVAIISEGNKKKDFAWIEVINLGQNAVEGIVTEVDDDCVYINGRNYTCLDYEYPRLGDEGIFYLTKNDEVFYFDLSASVFGNYGYILDIALNDSGFSEAWQVKLLTEDAGIVVYDVDDNFKVGQFNSRGELVKRAVSGDDANAPILSALENKNDHKADTATRLVRYKLNKSGYIKEINEVESVSIAFDSEYNADAQIIDRKSLEDDTVVFNVANSSEKSAYKTDIISLVDEARYSGIVALNEDGEYDCFVVLVGGSKINAASDIAVVESVTYITTEDDEEAVKVRYYISGDDEIKELVIVNDCEISEGYWGTDIEDVKKGSLIMFSAGENGIAMAYTVLANVDSGNAWDVNNQTLEGLVNEDDDNEFVVAPVYNIIRASSGEILDYGGGNLLHIKNSVNKYTVDNTKDTWLVDVADWKGGNAGIYDAAKKTATFFFARLHEGVVSEIITIGKRAACDLGDEAPKSDIGIEPSEDVNYGYILETAINDVGFYEIWRVKMLTENEGIVEYDVADEFRVNGTMLEGDDYKADILSVIEGSNDHKDNTDVRLVTYTLNISNEIKEINSSRTERVDYGIYNSGTMAIGRKMLTENAVVFDVSGSSAQRARAGDLSALRNYGEYGGIVATQNGYTYDCFVVTVGGSKIDPASDIAVVESVTDITTEDDEEAIKVRYYISDEADSKELVIVNDSEISEGYWRTDIEDVKKGSLLMFDANKDGVANAFTVLANVDSDNTWEVNESALSALVSEDDDNEFIVSAIYDYEFKTAGKVIKYTEYGDCLTIKQSTNKYTVDNTRRIWAIDVSDWQGGDVDKSDGDMFSWFFARCHNGVVTDFITIGEQSMIEPAVEDDDYVDEDDCVSSDANDDWTEPDFSDEEIGSDADVATDSSGGLDGPAEAPWYDTTVDAEATYETLQSSHPYSNNMDETKVYTYNGYCTAIRITFSYDTETESGYDFIYVYDINDNLICKGSGTQLAGMTMDVPGNTVKIRLTSDASITRYGYRLSNIGIVY